MNILRTSRSFTRNGSTGSLAAFAHLKHHANGVERVPSFLRLPDRCARTVDRGHPDLALASGHNVPAKRVDSDPRSVPPTTGTPPLVTNPEHPWIACFGGCHFVRVGSPCPPPLVDLSPTGSAHSSSTGATVINGLCTWRRRPNACPHRASPSSSSLDASHAHPTTPTKHSTTSTEPPPNIALLANCYFGKSTQNHRQQHDTPTYSSLWTIRPPKESL